MKKLYFIFLLLIPTLYAQTINVLLDTSDKQKALKLVEKELNQLSLKKYITRDTTAVVEFDFEIENFRNNLNEITQLYADIHVKGKDIKGLEENVLAAPKKIKESLFREYKKAQEISRVLYFLVVIDGLDEDENDKKYLPALNQYFLDNYAFEYIDVNEEYITKYTLDKLYTKSFTKEQLSNIQLKKEIGRLDITEVLGMTSYEKDGAELMVIRVMQYPFKQEFKKEKITITKEKNYYEKLDGVSVLEIENFQSLAKTIKKGHSTINNEVLEDFIKGIEEKDLKISRYHINIAKQNKAILKADKKIKTIFSRASNKLQLNIDELIEIKDELYEYEKNLKDKINNISKTKDKYSVVLKENTKLSSMGTYHLSGRFKNLKKDIVSITLEYLESEKSHVLSGTEELKNGDDLSTTTVNSHKSIVFNSIHYMLFLNKRGKLNMRLFASKNIKVLDKEDVSKLKLGSTDILFVPISKGSKVYYMAQTETTWKELKNYITQSQNLWSDLIDSECLKKTIYKKLPPKNKYNDYPAVCFEDEGVDNYIKFLNSQEDSKNIRLMTENEWVFFASNAKQTKYCWGDEEVKKLLKRKIYPANFDYGDNKKRNFSKVTKYEKNLIGAYNMCGNAFEMVEDDGDKMYIGFSYQSELNPIEDSYTRDKSSRMNKYIGLRLFYEDQ